MDAGQKETPTGGTVGVDDQLDPSVCTQTVTSPGYHTADPRASANHGPSQECPQEPAGATEMNQTPESRCAHCAEVEQAAISLAEAYEQTFARLAADRPRNLVYVSDSFLSLLSPHCNAGDTIEDHVFRALTTYLRTLPDQAAAAPVTDRKAA